MIKQGLSTVKEKISELLKVHTSSSDTRKLCYSQLVVNFNWKKIQKGLRVTASLTAETHYETWFYESFHRVKHCLEDEEYQRLIAPPLSH